MIHKQYVSLSKQVAIGLSFVVLLAVSPWSVADDSEDSQSIVSKSLRLKQVPTKDVPVPKETLQPIAGSSVPVEDRPLKKIPRLPPEITDKMYGLGVLNLDQLSDEEKVDLYNRSRTSALTVDQLNAGQYQLLFTTSDYNEAPGAKLPELVVAKDVDTYIVLVDSMGEPWPIQSARASGSSYAVSLINEHTIYLKVKKSFVTSNLRIFLEGKTLPMSIKLLHAKTLQSAVDMTKVYRISGISPSSTKTVNPRREEPIPDSRLDLNPFLDDLPPVDAIAVQVNGPSDVKVWTYKNKLVVRTQKELIQPAGLPLHGVNGFKVYEIENPLPVLVLLDEGQPHYAYIPEDSIAGLNKED